MINIITNSVIDVVEKQRLLVEEALAPDGAYIRAKETLNDLLDRGGITEELRAKVIGETISQIAIGITANAMSTGLQWAAKETENSFKKEEMSRTLALLDSQVEEAKEKAVASIAAKQLLQAQLIRDYGQPILDNDGNVVSLPNSGRLYETIENLKQDTANKSSLNTQIVAQTDEVYARTHRLVADTYINHGVFQWTTLGNNGMAGVQKLVTNYTTLSDLQKVVSAEQAKGYAYNAWSNAATSSGGMIGTLVAAEIPGLNYTTYLDKWMTAVTKINAVSAPVITI